MYPGKEPSLSDADTEPLINPEINPENNPEINREGLKPTPIILRLSDYHTDVINTKEELKEWEDRMKKMLDVESVRIHREPIPEELKQVQKSSARVVIITDHTVSESRGTADDSDSGVAVIFA